jgi:hypothetical protein
MTIDLQQAVRLCDWIQLKASGEDFCVGTASKTSMAFQTPVTSGPRSQHLIPGIRMRLLKQTSPIQLQSHGMWNQLAPLLAEEMVCQSCW